MKTKAKPTIQTAQIQTVYRCPDGIVTIIRKTQGLGRYPKHDYPCILMHLSPRPGTRVRSQAGGGVEYMASIDELRALLNAVDPALGNALPTHLRNKPRQRKEYFDNWNAKRHWARVRA